MEDQKEKLRRERRGEGYGKTEEGETERQCREDRARRERRDEREMTYVEGVVAQLRLQESYGPASMMHRMTSVFIVRVHVRARMHAPLCFLCNNNYRDQRACGNCEFFQYERFARIERICSNLFSQGPLCQDHLCFPPTVQCITQLQFPW